MPPKVLKYALDICENDDELSQFIQRYKATKSIDPT